MYAQVVLDIPLDTIFHYKIPDQLQPELKTGQWVEVPFRNRFHRGVAVCIQTAPPPFKGEIKEISKILSRDWSLSDDLLELTRWISQYYCCSWGEALKASVPAGVLKQNQQRGQVLKFYKSKESDFCQISRLDPIIIHTPEQKESLSKILAAMDRNAPEVFLLHGVTASGKTEIYLRAIETAVSKGKTAVLLAPEIALTVQLTRQFRSHFMDKVAILHSALSAAEKGNEWRRIYQGLTPIVIGARSAVFAPLKNLGVVIIDEEHEMTYKQDETPRYHAREVAIKRAQLCNAVVILGSATPSMESYSNAKKGLWQLLSLPQRVEMKGLPKVHLVDMREEIREHRQFTVFSRSLRSAIEGVLSRKEQGILFINRRGFSPFVQCQECGTVVQCKFCSVGLSFHSRFGKLLCHYCGYQTPPPSVCARCRRNALRYLGIGTEKVESELARLFPMIRSARLDSDSVRKRGSYEKIFRQFGNHELDFLIGTQMVAKGFDFPRVTLVGVVLADVTLHLADFRSSERTFNLLTQVAGRSGRGDQPGEVIIQTFSPTHYAVKRAQAQDYEGFFDEELLHRQETRFPPSVRLVDILFKGTDEKNLIRTARETESLFKRNSNHPLEVIGLSPCPVSRIRNRFYWHLLLRGEPQDQLSESVQQILRGCRQKRGVTIKIDVDPL